MNRLLALLIGNPRHHRIEIRLFNAVSILNGSANLAGSLLYLFGEQRSFYLFCLHLVVGGLFVGFYFYSRLKGNAGDLYWPFVLTLIAFLFLNILAEMGTRGGAHYYLIPSIVVATILPRELRKKILAWLLFVVLTLAILLIEEFRPDWIGPDHFPPTPPGYFLGVGGNLLFVLLFTGLLVLVLSRTLDQERHKSDRLLLSILPETVAEELKRNDSVTPRRYESASVLFTDFVGFTREAEMLSPENLLGELDELFTSFDNVIRHRKLEKIKTIGDAYMACGGLPEPSPTHAVDCVRAAFEIQRLVDELGRSRAGSGRPIWGLRAGIHSGPLVAGVIGQDKFAYDVWGDTVNTASRIETAGEAGRVNISSATHDLVSEFFVCEHRGMLPVKNKGSVDMYFVTSIRPELSENGEGLVPNQAFKEKYSEIAKPV